MLHRNSTLQVGGAGLLRAALSFGLAAPSAPWRCPAVAEPRFPCPSFAACRQTRKQTFEHKEKHISMRREGERVLAMCSRQAAHPAGLLSLNAPPADAPLSS